MIKNLTYRKLSFINYYKARLYLYLKSYSINIISIQIQTYGIRCLIFQFINDFCINLRCPDICMS